MHRTPSWKRRSHMRSRDAVEAAYARSTLLERRLALMAEWGRCVTGSVGAEVVQLHG